MKERVLAHLTETVMKEREDHSKVREIKKGPHM